MNLNYLLIKGRQYIKIFLFRKRKTTGANREICLAKLAFSFDVYLLLGGQSTRSNNWKMKHEEISIGTSSCFAIFFSISISWRGQEQKLGKKTIWLQAQTRIISIMRPWSPLCMMLLCVVLLSVLGEMKTRYNRRWWGCTGSQRRGAVFVPGQVRVYRVWCIWLRTHLSSISHWRESHAQRSKSSQVEIPWCFLFPFEISNEYLSTFKQIP
jgi:hypothetical protein